MTMNNRPVEDDRLQKALDEVKAVFARYGFAGCAMVISPEEAAFFYAMHAPWSAIRFRPQHAAWLAHPHIAGRGRRGRQARPP